MTQLRLGSAIADITPEWPLTLAGFAARTAPSQGISQPLSVKVSVLETMDTPATLRRSVVVVADLLWWGPQEVDFLRIEIAARAETVPEMVLLSATHTHSAPQTSTRASREIGILDSRYSTMVREQVLSATAEAVSNLESVTVTRYTGGCQIGFNRRHDRNPHGPIDPTLTVLRFDRADGSVATLWVHFTCHPVITQEPLVSSEFCGVAMGQLQSHFEAPALYLQGCCGDINPVEPGEVRSLRGTNSVVVQTGMQLAEAVKTLLTTGTPELLARIPLTATSLTVELPFAAIPDQNVWRERSALPGVDGELAEAMLDHPEWCTPTIPLTLQRLDIADGCSLLAMNGEIVVEYGLRIRTQSGGTVLPMGYANGMTGYIPTMQILSEGGYEAGEAAPYFFLPGPFDPVVESLMDDAIETILAN